jgi:leucyl aminopeptidase
VKVEAIEIELAASAADLCVVGLREGDALPDELAGAPGAGDAKGGFRRLAMLHPEAPPRVLAVGLGGAGDLGPERLRVAASLAAGEASRLGARSLAWVLPEGAADEAGAAALVTGTVLGSYRFDRFRGADPDDPPPPRIESLTLLGPAALTAAAESARICAEAQNRARDLQSTPANVATPAFLAARAEEIAAGSDALEVEVLGPGEIAARGMGGLVAVSDGGGAEPRLVALRYRGGGGGPTLGLIGKGVTFDSGGISLKPGAGMQEMKMDMSGAAAVLEAVAAIAELRLPVELLAVVPAT